MFRLILRKNFGKLCGFMNCAVPLGNGTIGKQTRKD